MRSILLNQRGNRASILSWLIYGAVCLLLGMVISGYANTYSIPEYSDWSTGTYTDTRNSYTAAIKANMLHIISSNVSILNSDFESTCAEGDIPPNWTLSAPGGCTLSGTISGVRSAYTNISGYMYQSVTLVSGQNYVLQALYAAGNNEPAKIRIGSAAGNGGTTYCSATGTTSGTLSCSFTSSTTSAIISLIADSAASDWRVFDNIILATRKGTWESEDIDLGYSTSVSAIKWYGDETATAYWDTDTSGAKQIEIKCATTQGGLTSESYVVVSNSADPGCDTIRWVKVKVTGQLTTAQDSRIRPHLWGIDIIYDDPTAWTTRTGCTAKQLRIDNNSNAATLTSGWVMDYLPGVSDISVATPTNISVTRYSAGTWTELDRMVRGKTINFKTQADINTWRSDQSYWLQYGCSSGTPSSNGSNIYSFFDNFDDDLFSASWTRGMLSLQVGEEFTGGGIDVAFTSSVAGSGTVTEATGDTEAFSGASLPSTFTAVVAGSQTSTVSSGKSHLVGADSTDDAGVIYRNEQGYRRQWYEPVTVKATASLEALNDNGIAYLLGLYDGTPANTTLATFNTKRIISVGITRSGAAYQWQIAYTGYAGDIVYWSGGSWITKHPVGFGSVSLSTNYIIRLIMDEYTWKVRISDSADTLIEETDPVAIFWAQFDSFSTGGNLVYYFWGEPLTDTNWANIDMDEFVIDWGIAILDSPANADNATLSAQISDGSGRWTDIMIENRISPVTIGSGTFYRTIGLYESTDSMPGQGCSSEERFIGNMYNNAGTYTIRWFYCDTGGTQYFWNGSSWVAAVADLTDGAPALYKHNRWQIICTNSAGCKGVTYGADDTKVIETTAVAWSTLKNDGGISDANNWRVFVGENNAAYSGKVYVDHFRVHKTGTTGVVEQNNRLELTATGKYGTAYAQKAATTTTNRRFYTKVTTGAVDGQRFKIGLANGTDMLDATFRWVEWAEFEVGSSQALMGAKISTGSNAYPLMGLGKVTENIAQSTTYEVEWWQIDATVYFKMYKTSNNTLIFSQTFGWNDYDWQGHNTTALYPTVMLWNDNDGATGTFYIDDWGEATMRVPMAYVYPFQRTNMVGIKHSIDDGGRVWYSRDTRLFYSEDEMDTETQVVDFSTVLSDSNNIEWVWTTRNSGRLMIGTIATNKFYISQNCSLVPADGDPCDEAGEWITVNFGTYVAGLTGCTGRPMDIQGGTYVDVWLATCYGDPSDDKGHILRSTNFGSSWVEAFDDTSTGTLHTHHVVEHKNTHYVYSGTHLPGMYKSIDGGDTWTKSMQKNIIMRDSSIPTSTVVILPDDDAYLNSLSRSISGSGSEELTNYEVNWGQICFRCNWDEMWYGVTWDQNNSKVIGSGHVDGLDSAGGYRYDYGVHGLVYSDNNGQSYEFLYDTSYGMEGVDQHWNFTGWISISKPSLYSVFLENGTHWGTTAINYSIKRSNFTPKWGRVVPVKLKLEFMNPFGDVFMGGI